MAAESSGGTLTTVVTCEGELSDPNFRVRFALVLDELKGLLGEPLKVHKLEPWNSVRVTLSIPKEAALRLRQLANDGAPQLRALGILSVQVEGDQVISLRLVGSANSEPQEIVLQTGPQDGSTNCGSSSTNLSQLLASSVEAAVTTEKVQFRSPNVVCPPDSIVPKVPVPSATTNPPPPTTKGYAGPFPFTSMNQAMHSNRESTNINNANNFTTPPPPYPGKHPPVTLSSPLLVNLLQNQNESAAQSRTIINPVQEHSESNSAHNMRKATVFLATTKAPVQSVKTNFPNNINASNVLLSNNLQANKLIPNNTVTNIRQTNIVQKPAVSKEVQLPQQPIKAPTVAAVSSTTARNPVPYSPYPPPYPNNPLPNNTRPWDQQSNQAMSQLQELIPSLPDLNPDLDHILPCLERDLAGSPLELPDHFLCDKMQTVFLINPLTGELEAQLQSDNEEDGFRDVFTGLPSPNTFSDEDTNSTIRPDTTDQSDSESRSCHSDSSKQSKVKGKSSRERGSDSPNLVKPTEKIKLRLKLEKSEPVSPAYKVDVSFINTQQPKKAVALPGEELRVPPLHISLRGRNHVVINNKKKVKLNPDGTLVVKAKPKKLQDHIKGRKEGDSSPQSSEVIHKDQTVDNNETRKAKKPKLNHDNKDKIGGSLSDIEQKDLFYNNHHYTEKLLLRRGSDSEITKNHNKKYPDSNGIVSDEKKRRLSQSDDSFDLQPATVLGSTNTGTVATLANHKIRKEKFKSKENFKNKDLNRFKSYSKNIAEKMNNKQVSLPTGEIDMEAKFKQRLLEDTDTRIIQSTVISPHRTEVIQDDNTTKNPDEKVNDLIQTLSDPPPEKDKPPEPDKCNTPDRKTDLQDKQPNRSPNSNSGAQGEDSGIESMDALSEKSPNQASQSPHADIPDTKNKNQVPDMLDIEAQLAKMEGLHSEEDMNENHNNQVKLEPCCGVLTSALQDSLSKGSVTLTQLPSPTIKEELPDVEVSLVSLKPINPVKENKEEDLEPLPLGMTAPLYTYSNSEKQGPDSPLLSDSDSNLCNPIRKSLLEQLLIEIPENQTPSSPSPATRSVRTRASSKMNSPELNSPVILVNKAPNVKTVANNKRKRNESDSSNNSLEDRNNKKPRKCSENAAELIKVCMGVDAPNNNKIMGVKKKVVEESSDSDEPLIEVAGKVRKNSQQTNAVTRVKLKTGSLPAAPPPAQVNVKSVPVNTRRSIRTLPVINTRSKGEKSNPESDVVRRKTRSAVSEGEGKRRKDVK